MGFFGGGGDPREMTMQIIAVAGGSYVGGGAKNLEHLRGFTQYNGNSGLFGTPVYYSLKLGGGVMPPQCSNGGGGGGIRPSYAPPMCVSKWLHVHV